MNGINEHSKKSSYIVNLQCEETTEGRNSLRMVVIMTTKGNETESQNAKLNDSTSKRRMSGE